MIHAPTPLCSGRTARRATATLWMLALLLLLSGFMVTLIEVYRLQTARVELQNSADAAALAAARAMVDDRLLAADPGVLGERLASARCEACRYAHNNGVFGDPVALDANDANDCGGDVVVGRLDGVKDKVFQAGEAACARSPAHLLLNAFHIHAGRTRAHGTSISWRLATSLGLPSATVAAEATAVLDRDVIGFRPDGIRNIPLVPIALLSDEQGGRPDCWERLVEQGAGPDDYGFDPVKQTVRTGADGLHEMTVTFRENHPAPDNVRLLELGVDQWSQVVQQVRRGVTAAEMASLPGGRLVLDASGQVEVPVFPLATGQGDSDLGELFAALGVLRDRGEARVWPLFRRSDAGSGDVVLTGFVAARVVRAEDAGDGRFELVVQPCMMATASAVTDAARRRADRTYGNPYICKIRIVQ